MFKSCVRRLFPLWVVLIGGLLVGCASDRSESSGFSLASLNPATWDFRDADYRFRKQMHFRVGDMWVIEPPRELNPMALHVYRSTTDMRPPRGNQPAVVPDQVQQLRLDLATGNGTFIDFDGKSYPLQFDDAEVNHFLTLARQRDWVYHDLPSPPTVPDPTHYRLVAVDPDPQHNVDAFWSLPPSPNQPHPELFTVIIHHFERAHRLAHPMSRSINLLD